MQVLRRHPQLLFAMIPSALSYPEDSDPQHPTQLVQPFTPLLRCSLDLEEASIDVLFRSEQSPVTIVSPLTSYKSVYQT